MAPRKGLKERTRGCTNPLRMEEKYAQDRIDDMFEERLIVWCRAILIFFLVKYDIPVKKICSAIFSSVFKNKMRMRIWSWLPLTRSRASKILGCHLLTRCYSYRSFHFHYQKLLTCSKYTVGCSFLSLS